MRRDYFRNCAEKNILLPGRENLVHRIQRISRANYLVQFRLANETLSSTCRCCKSSRGCQVRNRSAALGGCAILEFDGSLVREKRLSRKIGRRGLSGREPRGSVGCARRTDVGELRAGVRDKHVLVSAHHQPAFSRYTPVTSLGGSRARSFGFVHPSA